MYLCLPWSGVGSERLCVCPSICGWWHKCFSKSVTVSVHVRRVHVRGSSGGIPRAVSSHVRSMFEGSRRGWKGDGSLEKRGVCERVCWRRVSNVAAEGGGGGRGRLLSGTLKFSGPACLKGPFLSGADTSTPCPLPPPPLHPPQAPKGPPAGMEDTLSSSNIAPWTGSFIGRLFLVAKDSPTTHPRLPCSLGRAWRTPGPTLAWPSPFWTWLQIQSYKPAGTDGCRLEGQAAPQGGHSD